MGGSLDGLARVTRTVVESYYHQVHLAGNPGGNYPVVVIEGMNHAQWGNGSTTTLINMRDIRAELSVSEALETAGHLAADFLTQLETGNGGWIVDRAVNDTGDFAAPLINAYELEGSKNFNSPRQIGGPLENTCYKGKATIFCTF